MNTTNTTISNDESFRFWLQSELMQRCKRNPHYSLRSFANLLGMDASTVSQLISGKRRASTKVITQICDKLSALPELREKFLKGTQKKNSEVEAASYEIVAEDVFAFISNWYHYAILELTFADGFENNPGWIARMLGLTTTEAKMAIERLIRMGLLSNEDGLLKKTNKFITNFAPGQTSAAHKELQKSVIQMALEAVENIPQEEKDITSMTMAIDVDKLPEARKLITKFRRELCAFLEDGHQTRVYQMGLQLYPVSKKV